MTADSEVNIKNSRNNLIKNVLLMLVIIFLQLSVIYALEIYTYISYTGQEIVDDTNNATTKTLSSIVTNFTFNNL